MSGDFCKVVLQDLVISKASVTVVEFERLLDDVGPFLLGRATKIEVGCHEDPRISGCGRCELAPDGVRRCSSRTCPEFAPIWARDTRRRLQENLRTVKLTVMFSVTALGSDLYPFDPRFCSHRPVERCSGVKGCRVDPEAATAFNRRAGGWWSELHRAAKTRADRETAHKGRLLVRVWEKQARGLAHVHGVIGVGGAIEIRWADAYVGALREMAPSYGFGFVDGWRRIGRRFRPGAQAAAYLSSYFVRGSGRKASITERAGDLPRVVVFVSRELTARTGCTMRSLRIARRLWVLREGLADPPNVSLREWLAAAAMLEWRRIE